MAEKPLVDGLYEDSTSLIQRLDSQDFSPSFAVWYYYQDAQDWRLLLGGQGIDGLLPKQEALAYQKISESLSELELRSLSISLVKVIRTQEALPQAIKTVIGTASDSVGQAHFLHTTINGIFIEEMIVIRSAIGSA